MAAQGEEHRCAVEPDPEVVRPLLRQPRQHLLSLDEPPARHQGLRDGEAQRRRVRPLRQRVHGLHEHREGVHRPARQDQVFGNGERCLDRGGRGCGLPRPGGRGRSRGGHYGRPRVCACVTAPGPAQDSASASSVNAANRTCRRGSVHRPAAIAPDGCTRYAVPRRSILVGDEAADHPQITAVAQMMMWYLERPADGGVRISVPILVAEGA